MKTIDEFSAALEAYFGTVGEAILDDILAEIEYVKPSDLDALLRQIKISTPAKFSPDLKTVVTAIRELRLDLLDEARKERSCPVCGTKWYSSGVCPCCKYDGGIRDGTPEEYGAWWTRWKEGKEPRFDVRAILAGLERKTRVECGELQGASHGL